MNANDTNSKHEGGFDYAKFELGGTISCIDPDPVSHFVFGTHIVNEYEEEFDSKRAALEFGKKWHSQLKGNDDYVNNRIILNVSGYIVTLAQFSDSKTNVEIDGDVYEGRLKLEPVEAA